MRDAFAGVRETSRDGDDCDLSCCVYGRGCTVFADTDLAASLEAGQHLQAWLGDTNVMVDRYDVRLLLHDTTQISKASNRKGLHTLETDGTHGDLEYERYRDLNSGSSSDGASPEKEPPAAGISIYQARLLEFVLNWFTYMLRILV